MIFNRGTITFMTVASCEASKITCHSTVCSTVYLASNSETIKGPHYRFTARGLSKTSDAQSVSMTSSGCFRAHSLLKDAMLWYIWDADQWYNACLNTTNMIQRLCEIIVQHCHLRQWHGSLRWLITISSKLAIVFLVSLDLLPRFSDRFNVAWKVASLDYVKYRGWDIGV